MFFLTNLSAQVTIGSTLTPVEGALLEIKDRDAGSPQSVTDARNVTSTTGGLELPRVHLVNATTLEPLVPADADWNADKDKVKARHAGLMVYNIQPSDTSQTNPNLIFHEGIYTWNGSRWTDCENPDKKERFFSMPPFHLPLTSLTQTLRFNVYEEYKRQFAKDTQNSLFVSSNPQVTRVLNGENRRLYAADELDFVVTWYNSDYIEVVEIDKTGELSYYAFETRVPEPVVLINILFIIK